MPGLATRPEVQEVVDRIDREQGASTDDLVSEIELFLRQQPPTKKRQRSRAMFRRVTATAGAA